MRRPWLDRKSKPEADHGASPRIGDLTGALRARLDALEDAARAAADGVESDFTEFKRRGGEAADEAGAEALVSALGERMRKIGADADEVSALLRRYTEIAEAAGAGQAGPAGGAGSDEGAAAGTEAAVSGSAAVAGPGADSAAAALRWESEAPTGETDREESPVAVSAKSLDGVREAPHAGGEVEISEGIRLLATQMSMSGTGRGEIERRLREDFGVQNASAVVAKLFGA